MTNTPTCPDCGSAVGARARYCEECGLRLGYTKGSTAGSVRTENICTECAEALGEGDDYCPVCGHRRSDGTDHLEIDLGTVGAVSDRGRRHQRNEDAVAIGRLNTSGPPLVAVAVCDGVSSAPGSQEASRAAADVTLDDVLDQLDNSDEPDYIDIVIQAIAAGARKVGDLVAAGPNAPACTMVTAIIEPAGDEGRTAVHLGWLGDSRAYWLPYPNDQRTEAPHVLTRDHTVAAELAAAQSIPLSELGTLPGAHVITRWLGTDSDGGAAEVDSVNIPGAGIVLICTDGLWNYFPNPEDMAEAAFSGSSPDETPVEMAARLTDLANAAGGHDNITVAVVPVPLAIADSSPPRGTT